MPEICRFFGIVIQMYANDHVPPHFHAIYGGFYAHVRIAPVVLLHGRLPPRVFALIVEWATLHRDELLSNWERLRQGRSEGMDVDLPPDWPYPGVTAVEVVPPYGLRLQFADGTSGLIDGSRWVHREPAGMFERLRDPAEFAKVRLLPEWGTIVWPNDVDLCPDVLYVLAHGIHLPGIDQGCDFPQA